MSDAVIDVVSWIALTSGGFFILVGGIGALRLPDFYTRMHAASVTDTIATFLIIGGIMLQSGLTLATIKLVAILAFLLLTSPTASYALANAALLSGVNPQSKQQSALSGKETQSP